MIFQVMLLTHNYGERDVMGLLTRDFTYVFHYFVIFWKFVMTLFLLFN